MKHLKSILIRKHGLILSIRQRLINTSWITLISFTTFLYGQEERGCDVHSLQKLFSNIEGHVLHVQQSSGVSALKLQGVIEPCNDVYVSSVSLHRDDLEFNDFIQSSNQLSNGFVNNVSIVCLISEKSYGILRGVDVHSVIISEYKASLYRQKYGKLVQIDQQLSKSSSFFYFVSSKFFHNDYFMAGVTVPPRIVAIIMSINMFALSELAQSQLMAQKTFPCARLSIKPVAFDFNESGVHEGTVLQLVIPSETEQPFVSYIRMFCNEFVNAGATRESSLYINSFSSFRFKLSRFFLIKKKARLHIGLWTVLPPQSSFPVLQAIVQYRL